LLSSTYLIFCLILSLQVKCWFPPIIISTGFYLKTSLANSLTSLGHVALNINVCLSGLNWDIISSIWGLNPISNIRSASSNTKYVTSFKLHYPSFIKSINLPGVAINKFTPFLKSLFWLYLGTPPAIQLALIDYFLLNLLVSTNIWLANSLVGAKIKQRGFLPLLFMLICFNPGNIYDNVLPDPVLASDTKSYPFKAHGHVCIWTGVGLLNFNVSVNKFIIYWGKFNSLKDVIMGIDLKSPHDFTIISFSILMFSISILFSICFYLSIAFSDESL